MLPFSRRRPRSQPFPLTAFLIVAALGLGAGGCALGGGSQELMRLVWPEPPLPARIQFVTAVASERDFQSGLSLKQIVDVGLIGRQPRVWHLYQPIAVATSKDGGRAYVADYSQALLYIFDFARDDVSVIGEDGGFIRPIGVAVDATGQVYVSDQANNVVQILAADGKPVGSFKLENIGQAGGIAIDAERSLLYVTDTGGTSDAEHWVQVYDLHGKHIRRIGNGRGIGDGEFHYPTYIAVGGGGEVYVSDTLNSRVSVFDAEGSFVRQIGRRGDNMGDFDKPKGVALDTFGNMYVVDSSWSVVQIFNSRDDILLFFGGRSRYPGMLQNPTGIAIDGRNRIYVCDTFNHRLSVYELVNTTAADSFLEPDEAPAGEKGAPASQTTPGGQEAGGNRGPNQGGEKAT